MPFGVVVFTKKSQLPLSIIYIKQFSSIFYKKNFKKAIDIIHFNDIIEFDEEYSALFCNVLFTKH